MDQDKVKPLLLAKDDVLRSAIAAIDAYPQYGVGIVVDDNRKLFGLLTNGDVYRTIFSGAGLETKLEQICNRDPIVLHQSKLDDPHAVRECIKKLLSREGFSLPIIDDERRVVGIAHYQELEKRLNESALLARGKQRVLVLGGGGYLGTVLTRQLLESGYSARVVDNFTHGNRSIYDLPGQERLEIIEGDIRNIATVVSALEGVSAVVLLAAVVGDPASKNNPRQTVEINYLAAKMIAEACKYAHISRLIFASTCSVYGQGKSILDESSPLHPVSHYAKTKIAAEQAILSLADAEFSPSIMRMSTLYGMSPRMRFDLVVNVFGLKAVREKLIQVHGGQQWRPLLHTEDAAEAFIKVLEAPKDKIAGQVFNVGSERQNYRIIELAEAVQKVYPDVRVQVESGSEDSRDYQVSFEKIRKTLGFEPHHDIVSAVRDIGQYVSRNAGRDFQAGEFANYLLEY